MSQNQFNNVVESLLKGMGTLLSSHTVVGEATRVGDAVIVPLVDVSFGIGAGAGDAAKRASSNGGFGAKMSPSAVLIIQDGKTRLVNVKNQDAVTRILDLVPQVMERFGTKSEGTIDDDEAVEAAFGDRAGDVSPDKGETV